MGNNAGKVAADGKFSEQEIERFQRRFQRLSKGSDGVSVKLLAGQPEFADNPMGFRLLHMFDSNKDGILSSSELFELLSAFPTLSEDNRRAEFVFRTYDVDNDGRISQNDFKAILKVIAGPGMSDKQLSQVAEATIRHYDNDKDGYLSKREFQLLLADEGAGKIPQQ